MSELDAALISDGVAEDKGNDSNIKIKKFPNNIEFKVITIDSHEKWQKASDISFVKEIVIDGKKIKFNLKCVSLGRFKYINENYPMPERDTNASMEDQKEAVSDAEISLMQARRRVLYFEGCSGKLLPGKDLDDKARILLGKPVDLIDRVFEIVNNHACASIDNDQSLEYNALRSKHAEVIEVNDIESFLSDENLASRMFAFGRPFDDIVIEIPLKTIASQRRSEIEESFKIPSPPQRPGKNFDVQNPVAWYDEPHYVAKVRNIRNRKFLAFLEECLMFKIPGTTEDEKTEWLNERPVGDILKLQLYVQRELVDSSMAISFF